MLLFSLGAHRLVLMQPLLLFVSGFCMEEGGKGIQATCLVQGSADSLNHLLTHHGHLSAIPHLHRTFMLSTPITRFFGIPVTRVPQQLSWVKSEHHSLLQLLIIIITDDDRLCYNLWDGNGNRKMNYRCSQMDERFAMDAPYSLLNTYVQAADYYLENQKGAASALFRFDVFICSICNLIQRNITPAILISRFFYEL